MANEQGEEQASTIMPMTAAESSEALRYVKMRERWQRNYPHMAKAMDDAQRSLAALEAVLVEDRVGGEPGSESETESVRAM